MIFWISLGIVALAMVGTFIYWLEWGDLGMGFAGALLGAIISGTICVLIFLAAFSWWVQFSPSQTDQNTYSLAALNTGSETDGRFYFLGGGYINDHRVLNYIRQDDNGAFLVKSVDADDALIYEDGKGPEVIIRDYEYRNDWVFPWPVSQQFTAEFHVPPGSVLQDYSVTNQ